MNRPARYVLPIVLLALLASCGTESDPPAKATATSTSSANHRDDIEVLDAVLVMNDDGSATLSARIVNHSDAAREMSSAFVGEIPNEGATMRVFPANKNVIPAGGEATTGGASDPVRIRVTKSPEAGAKLPVSLEFDFEAARTITTIVPVVARTPTYDDVAGNKPNTAIKVLGAKIVVVPGQKKAYVGGSTTGTITDQAWELPTAVDAKGHPVEYRHQTATGGPYGILVEAGKTIPFGGPPWVVSEDEPQGDADYFNAKDIKVGETITVTIPFQSGDVVTAFKVVAD
jgi:hypothetical protein